MKKIFVFWSFAINLFVPFGRTVCHKKILIGISFNDLLIIPLLVQRFRADLH